MVSIILCADSCPWERDSLRRGPRPLATPRPTATRYAAALSSNSFTSTYVPTRYDKAPPPQVLQTTLAHEFRVPTHV